MADQQIPDYLIITNEALKPVFERLADWKTQKGVYAVIKTTEEIAVNYAGVDLAEKIRNFLKDAYRFWGAGLYVLLGGDTNIIPDRKFYYYYDDENNKKVEVLVPADLYYTTTSGSWDKNKNGTYNETAESESYDRVFYLGRASVEDSTEAGTFVNKVLIYEKTEGVPNLSYFKNCLAASAYLSKTDNSLGAGGMRTINSIFQNTIPESVHKWRLYDNHHCDNNSGHTYPYSGPCGPSSCPCGDEELNYDNFLSALQNGGNSGFGPFHLVYHMDHSSEYSLGASNKDKSQQLSMAEIDGLTNAPYYQIFMTSGCKPANFGKDCIAEHYLNNPSGGAVAVIGNSDVGWSSDIPQFEDFAQTIYAKPTTATYGQYALGFAFQKSFPRGSNNIKNTRLTLLGDPEMPVWTDQPKMLTVSLNKDTLFSGNNLITATFPNLPTGEAARICLRKDNEAYSISTVNGPGPHYIGIRPETEGNMEITVTAHNFIPYEATIPVRITKEKSLSVCRVEVDDSLGNQNGRADAGELIFLRLTLKNNGSKPIAGISVYMANPADCSELTNNGLSFGTIQPGDSSSGVSPFGIRIFPNAQESWKNNKDHSSFFSIGISDSENNSYSDYFNIDILTPELELRNRNITRPGNLTGPIGPNETIAFSVDLFNKGSGDANGLTSSLSGISSSAIASYTSSPVLLTDIVARNEKRLLGSYQITTAPGYSGGPLNMTLTILNRYGKKWSFPFDLNEAPVSLQGGVKQEADDHSVSLTWYFQPGVKGYNVYRGDAGASGEDTGVYRKLNAFLVQSGYFKDEGLPPTRPYFYKVVPVSASGNEGVHSGAIFACTSPTIAPNFPLFLDAKHYLRGAINTADTDLDGFQEIFFSYSYNDSNKGKIGMVRHDGTDGYNIDGNVTTRADFAAYGPKVHASVGLADLNRDGDFQVISLTRSEGVNDPKNSIFCHSVYDRDNDHLPDLCWRRDTTGNFFKAAAIADLNPEDGGRSVVVYSDPGELTVLDNRGKILRKIMTPDGNYTASSVALGDLDGDGRREIVAGATDGLYIWRNDGTPFGSSNPFFRDSRYQFSSTPILCDLDMDGEKEILITAVDKIDMNPLRSRIFALKWDGSMVPGWNGSQWACIKEAYMSHQISVGDLDRDGNLEVVFVGSDSLRVWRNNGVKMLAVKIPEDNFDPFCFTPILADVDGDTDIEVIFAKQYGTKIHAYNIDGKSVAGFPITVPCVHSTPCVADVDNDGKNELIAGGYNILYMWKTNGLADRIEWGSDMHDSFNSGDYSFKTPLVVSKNENWTDNLVLDRDLIVNAEALTIGGTVGIPASSRLTIRPEKQIVVDDGVLIGPNICLSGGGTCILKNTGTIGLTPSSDPAVNPIVTIAPNTHLILDGATLLNANIRILNGGKLSLKNNASIRLNKSYGNLQIDAGGEFNQEYGSVETMP